MPNWTTNQLIIHKDDLRLIVNGEGHVDFNLLRPQPGTLVVSAWSDTMGRLAEEIALGKGELPEEWQNRALSYELGDGTTVHIDEPTLDDWTRFGNILAENRRLYGSPDWYDWDCENWGTKWNACETECSEPDEKGWCLVTFDTAWSQPSPEMMMELEQACTHPIYMEATYEGEDIVVGIDGHRIPESEWVLHSQHYYLAVPENDLDFSDPIEMDVLDDRWHAVDEGKAEGYAWREPVLSYTTPSEAIEEALQTQRPRSGLKA